VYRPRDIWRHGAFCVSKSWRRSAAVSSTATQAYLNVTHSDRHSPLLDLVGAPCSSPSPRRAPTDPSAFRYCHGHRACRSGPRRVPRCLHIIRV